MTDAQIAWNLIALLMFFVFWVGFFVGFYMKKVLDWGK